MPNKIFKYNTILEIKQFVKDQKQQLDYFNRQDYRIYDYNFVYLLVFSNTCKIGISTNPYNRIQDIIRNAKNHNIQLKNLYLSRLCTNAKIIEKDILNKYKKFNYSNEWLNLSDKMIEEIVDYMNCLDYNYDFMSKKEYVLYMKRSENTIRELINQVRGKPNNKNDIWIEIILDNKYNFDTIIVEDEIYKEIERLENKIINSKNNLEKRIINVFIMDNLYDLKNNLLNKIRETKIG